GARRGRGRTGRFLGSVAVVVLAVGIPVGAVAWDWRPADSGDGPGGAAPSGQDRTELRTPAATTPPAKAPAEQTTAPEAKRLDLLTPAGVRTAIAAVKEASGGTKVTGFVVYPEYAVAEALVKGSTKRFDRYLYRGGEAVVRQGSGTAFPGSVPADLSSVDWDVLPALLKRAERELGVAEPTSRYVVLVPASTIAGNGLGIIVYLSDSYGSASLHADARGRVTASYPRKD
ncbi:serine or threonine protein kinase, partial [Streptomyces sp. CBMA291]|nr:serine or threonine protein kinase [Streptomyces sp. CBMA291]